VRTALSAVSEDEAKEIAQAAIEAKNAEEAKAVATAKLSLLAS
jgi:hypothetical protein